MHRNVRALSRGLALIGELNASGPSNVVQLAKRTGLNRTTCYRLLDTLREDGYVTFDETNALFGLTPQVRTLERRRVFARLVEPGGASGDVQPARRGILAERLRGLRTRLGADPREHPPLQSILGSSVHGGPQEVSGAQRAREGHPSRLAAAVAPRDARPDRFARRGRRRAGEGSPLHRRHPACKRRRTVTHRRSEDPKPASAPSHWLSRAVAQFSAA